MEKITNFFEDYTMTIIVWLLVSIAFTALLIPEKWFFVLYIEAGLLALFVVVPIILSIIEIFRK